MTDCARWRAGFSLVALLCVAGCSTFDRDWDAAGALHPAGSTDITGRWQGNWASNVSSHSGELRCLITRDSDRKLYHARYAATYLGVFHFNYDMDMTGQREGEWVKLSGQADLGGMAGGVYHYDAHANATDFFATYKSDEDNGRFTLKRP